MKVKVDDRKEESNQHTRTMSSTQAQHKMVAVASTDSGNSNGFTIQKVDEIHKKLLFVLTIVDITTC
jgi:hypothetical protein